MCLCTCYEEGGLQRNMGPSEAAADTLVGPRVPGLDLRDQQCAVGEQDQTVEKKQVRHSQLSSRHR